MNRHRSGEDAGPDAAGYEGSAGGGQAWEEAVSGSLIALVIIGILIAAFVLLSVTSRRSLDMDEFYGFLD